MHWHIKNGSRQLRFSPGTYIFLVALGLTLSGGLLPWPLHYLRYALLPYGAFAVVLMSITGLDVPDELWSAGPPAMILVVIAIGPAFALYYLASLVAVSYSLGAAFSLVRSSVRKPNTVGPPAPVSSDKAAASTMETTQTFTTNKRICLWFGSFAAMIVLASCLALNFRGEASNRRVGSVSFSPLSNPAWKHGWPLTWLAADMTRHEQQAVETSRATAAPITHRWSLNSAIEQTINDRASWSFLAMAIDACIALILTVLAGAGAYQLSNLVLHVTSHSNEGTN